MKNNFQKISLFISLVIFLSLSVIFIFLYVRINKNNDKAQQNLLMWNTETERRNEIKLLDASLETIADKKAMLETHFAQSSDIVPFLDTLEKLAPEVGASAQVNSVDTSPEDNLLLVGLSASGSFESVYKFLTLLENSPFELEFLSMDIHNSGAVNSAGKNITSLKWDATFKIKLLSFIPSVTK